MPRPNKGYDYPVARSLLAHPMAPFSPGTCTALSAHKSICSAYAQSHEELAVVEQFFTDRAEGVFVEMGALDGVALSNTLALERSNLSWGGVLIEANPAMCPLLRMHRARRATTLCAGVSPNFSTVLFERGRYTATFAASDAVAEARASLAPGLNPSLVQRRGAPVAVPSAPLGFLLRSVGIAFVDFFSLDVEGSEARVLATMDWSIPVRVWCIEWDATVAPASVNRSIHTIMTRNGYERTAWAHEEVAARTLRHNQLWVRQGPWEPERYRWRPWAN